jgi:glycosyltransferase involved in cell wall biosynthesis
VPENTVAGRPLRVVVLNWRDLTHPEGGGSERYIETVARGLAARGHDVVLWCAAHGRAPREETVDGVRYVRRGGRATVYPLALLALLRRRFGRVDVVVDVSNGVPFFSPLVRRGAVVGLMHHVHREQWPVVMPGPVARVGWFLESRVAPRVFRRRPMVTVSWTTRREMVGLGYAETARVVHNGTTGPDVAPRVPRAGTPTICVLGRVVPHKRVDHAVEVLAALRHEVPGLRLVVVGTGWAVDDVAARARELGVDDAVELTGFVDEATKHELLAASWVHLCPSLKEGWGLSVMEAAWHGVPTVAYADAGGLSESVVDGSTGVLVHDLAGLVGATRDLLLDDDRRTAMATAAAAHARAFTWEQTVDAFDRALQDAVRGEFDSRPLPRPHPAPAP